MTTIYDVAEKAGVSVATVSRVLNNHSYVSPATRKKVLKVLEETNFVRNGNASSLTKKRTQALALLVPDITISFFTTLARGAEDKAMKSGYTLVLCNTDEDQIKETRYLQMLLEKRVDGIIMAPVSLENKFLPVLTRKKVPVVLVDRESKSIETDVVRGDSFWGAYQLVSHLINLGHRRIGTIIGPPSASVTVHRMEGYRKALLDHGVEFDPTMVYEGANYKVETGYTEARSLLESKPKPTAIFAANNALAVGLIMALREAGVRIPEDVALVCFDDIGDASTISPFLTVAAQPAYVMGRIATEILIERLTEGDAHNKPVNIVLQPEIIVRESCGAKQKGLEANS